MRVVPPRKVVSIAKRCRYLPPSVSDVPSNPARPSADADEWSWVDYFDATAPRYIDTRPEISTAVAAMAENPDTVLVGGTAMYVAFRALLNDREKVKTISTLEEMRSALTVSGVISAMSVRMDHESMALTDPGTTLTAQLHKSYTLVFTARRLLARMTRRHETCDDGAAVMGITAGDAGYSYGLNLVCVTYLGLRAVLSQNEWSQTLRSFAAHVVWEHTALLYTRLNKTMSNYIWRALGLVREAWREVGVLAPHVLHKAHSRALASLNADSPCADLQDNENKTKWSAKYGEAFPAMWKHYSRFASAIEGAIDEFGPGLGLIPGAAYRILPEAPGDHLQAMSNYVTKAIDFGDTDEDYNRAVNEVLLELDALAISAAAHRKDVPMPRIRSRAELEQATGRVFTDEQYDAFTIAARNRYLNLTRGQVLTRSQAMAFDPRGVMRKISWRDNLLAHAKDRAMMPANHRDLLDYKRTPSFKAKNKLAYVALSIEGRHDVDQMIKDGRGTMAVATDVKPEMAKPGDAKRLFYESQPAAWVLLGETDESIGENLAPINGFMVGKSSADQATMFARFVEDDENIPWFFCTDVEGFSRNMGEPLNKPKANRYAVYLDDPDAAYVGEYYTEAAVYGRDKFGVYGPVHYGCDFEGMSGKANTGYHLGIMKAAIGDLKRYLADELHVWAGPARFMCLIDDGILRVALRRKLTSAESARAYQLLAAAYERRHHRIDPTKAFYGHRLAVFLDRTAIDGEPVRNWTKVLGKTTADVDDPLASWDLKVGGIYATAQGMCDAGAPAWIAGTLAANMALHACEVFSGGKVTVADGFSLLMPIELGGYGGARYSLLSGVGLTDPGAEAAAIVRKLVAAIPSGSNQAIVAARACAISVWRAKILPRSNVAVLRNPGGISLDVAKLDVTMVAKATQQVMSTVVPWYDKDTHNDLIEDINKIDVTGVTNLAVAVGLDRVTLLHKLDSMVSKIRKARFLMRILAPAVKDRIRKTHKSDIAHVRQWFMSRIPRLPSTARGMTDYMEIYRLH